MESKENNPSFDVSYNGLALLAYLILMGLQWELQAGGEGWIKSQV